MTVLEKTRKIIDVMPQAQLELVYNFAMSVSNLHLPRRRSREEMQAALDGMRKVWAGHETGLSFAEMKHEAMKERYALAD